MTVVRYEVIRLVDRAYLDHLYQIVRYPITGKVDIRIKTNGSWEALKMSNREAEELIVRLQFAIYEQEEGK